MTESAMHMLDLHHLGIMLMAKHSAHANISACGLILLC